MHPSAINASPVVLIARPARFNLRGAHPVMLAIGCTFTSAPICSMLYIDIRLTLTLRRS